MTSGISLYTCTVHLASENLACAKSSPIEDHRAIASQMRDFHVHEVLCDALEHTAFADEHTPGTCRLETLAHAASRTVAATWSLLVTRLEAGRSIQAR